MARARSYIRDVLVSPIRQYHTSNRPRHWYTFIIHRKLYTEDTTFPKRTPSIFSNMRASLLPLFVLLAQYTITMSAAPVTATLEKFGQILSDLVIPQEQQNSTAAAKAAASKQSSLSGTGQVLASSLNPSKGTNGTESAPTVTISARETNPSQLQITRNLLPGKRFWASSGQINRAVAK